MKYIVYVLRSIKDGRRYIGCTSDLNRRLREHSQGRVKSTRNRRPLELVYTEVFGSKSEASKREKYYKTGVGRAKLESRGL